MHNRKFEEDEVEDVRGSHGERKDLWNRKHAKGKKRDYERKYNDDDYGN